MRFIAIGSLSLIASCSDARSVEHAEPEPVAVAVQHVTTGEVSPRMLRRFKPIAARFEGPDPITPEKVALGRKLFGEVALSSNRNISCDSCHDLDAFGADGRAFSVGTNGALGARNSPTVFNAAGGFAQMWDGHFRDVEEQAKAPILNAKEMGMPNAAAVEERLRTPAYEAAFRAAFPDDPRSLSFDNVARALGAFERTLSTPGRWDRYLGGDANALTSAEKEGLKTFLNVGCMVCHTGANVGGSMFERAGVVEVWPNQADQGRFEVTHLDADRMMFKVPTLRNVEHTAPYFHDGSARSLEDAVRMMGRHQLGLDLSAAEVTAITTWLKSLSGEDSSAAQPVAEEISPSKCGTLENECPLQRWMRSNLATAMTARDFKRIELSLTTLARLGPKANGFERWSELATKGAAAAHTHDLEHVREACQSCHDDMRARWKSERRDRPFP